MPGRHLFKQSWGVDPPIPPGTDALQAAGDACDVEITDLGRHRSAAPHSPLRNHPNPPKFPPCSGSPSAP